MRIITLETSAIPGLLSHSSIPKDFPIPIMSDSHAHHISFIAPQIAELAPLFPAYNFDCLIATGGMGAVYRAVQKSLDRKVAIKILPQEFGKDAAFAASFEAEAKAMARLNHPNLIGVFDFGEVNGMLYIVMEYVPGKSLYHSAHGRAIEVSKVIDLITGICSGLSHAHKFGIIHRDIKPSNILLDQNAQPKIGDFGLARPVNAKIPEGTDIFGTPHYTAPEVLRSPQAVGHRADIFSVGILLHELLTGRLPTEDPRPASTIIKCDHRFDEIIRRASDPMPELRYFSADEIIRDLQTITRPAGTAKSAKSSAPAGSAAPVAPGAAPQTARRAATKGTPRKVLARQAQPITYRRQLSLLPTIVITMAIIFLGVLVYNLAHKPVSLTESIPPEPPPVVQKQPEPEPQPQPETPPESKIHFEVPPAPGTTATSKTDSDLDDFDAKPKADVPTILTQTRNIMLELVAPISKRHANNLKKNFWTFRDGTLSCASALKSDRVSTTASVDKSFGKMESDGARVPDELVKSLSRIPGVREIHVKLIEEQKNIDFEYRRDIEALTSTYLLGLRKQIDRLKAEKDPGAIRLIGDEVAKVRDDPEYFVKLMLGNEFEKVKAKDPAN